jgi:Xaa-Pro aminopeptidase
LSFVLAHADGTADLFVAPEKVTDAVRAHLGNAVRLHAREEFVPALKAMRASVLRSIPNVRSAIFGALEDGRGQHRRAARSHRFAKGAEEPGRTGGAPRRAGARRRGAQRLPPLAARSKRPRAGVTELSAAAKLQDFREATGQLRDLSSTRSPPPAPMARIPSLPVERGVEPAIEPAASTWSTAAGSILMAPPTSPAPFWVGPGEPTAEMKDRFTRVLKGHIALALAVFPEGTRGQPARYDGARNALWQAASITPTAPATASAVSSRSTKDRSASPSSPAGRPGTGEAAPRHDPVERAGLLQGRRIWHPHRKSDPGRTERQIAGAEGTYYGFETSPGRRSTRRWSTPACSPATSCAGGTTITPACWRLSARSWRARRRTGWRRLVRRLGGG